MKLLAIPIAMTVFALFNCTRATAASNEHRPVCSADGTKMVFMMQTERTNNDWELYIEDLQSHTRSRLTNNRGWDGYAVWSPDGNSIIFEREVSTDKPRAPWIMDLDDRSSKPLGRFEGQVSISDWSDDNRLLGFHELNGQRDLVLLDLDGNITGKVTDTANYSEHDAQFSPDGQKVAYANGAVNGSQSTLEVINLKDGSKTILRTSIGRIYGVSWSPQGDKIAFVDAPDGEDDDADIFMYNIKEQNFKQVTDDPSWDHMPMFCVNSDSLFFTSNRSGEEKIYRINPDPKPFLKIERAAK